MSCAGSCTTLLARAALCQSYALPAFSGSWYDVWVRLLFLDVAHNIILISSGWRA